jgi:hypothetical protein
MILKLALAALFSCPASLTALFTPRHPQLGAYEVCTADAPLGSVAPPGWTVESVAPLDAFGTAGSYDRPRLSRVYGGTRARVARGWAQDGNRFESVTLISPYPDESLTRLLPGTMAIRFTVSPK